MNPLLIRHLYSSVRKKRFFWLLSLYLLAIGGIILILSLLTSVSSYTDPTKTPTISMLQLFVEGRVLYWFSSAILLLTAGFLIPINALGALSGERENRTLDLLRTTTLHSRDIVLGKMGSVLLTGAVYVLAPIPLLMTGYWLGGVTTKELLITLWLLMLTMVSSIVWALFLSSLVRKTIAAVVAFYGLAIATVPVGGALFLIASSIYDLLYYGVASFKPTGFWMQAMVEYGWIVLTGLHPISAGIVSEVYGLEDGTWFLLNLPVSGSTGLSGGSFGGTIYLPSPWIIYSVFAIASGAFFLWRTTQRLKKPAR